MRSEFEKLEDVKDILEDHKNIYFDSKSNMYAAKKEETADSVSYPSWEVTYLNGANYAWQHRQTEVDELQNRVEAFKDHAAMLRKAAKSHVYTEREQNILLSQADDIDKILGLEQALKGEGK